MGPSDTPSSPSFPVLEPIILDTEMENMYGDRDMEYFDPSVLDNSSPHPDRESEDFLNGTSGNRAIADSLTSISPSKLAVKQHPKDTSTTRKASNPLPPESLSESPGNSSGSCSSTSSGNHLRHTSFNSNVSGPFESPTFAKQYTPSWPNRDETLLGLDTGINSLPGGFSIGTDIESSNKAMDSAFDFEGAASSPSPLKTESTSTGAQSVSPNIQSADVSKNSNRGTHTKSSSQFPQSTSPFYFQESRDHSPSSTVPGLTRSTSNGWDGPSPSAGLEETFGGITMNTGSPLNSTLSPSLNFGQGGFSFESPENSLAQQKRENPFTAVPPTAPPPGKSDLRPMLIIHPTALKSRVETQIPIRMTLYPLPMGVKKLRLPTHTISKPKFLAKPDTERSPEVLELHTSLFCTSAMQDQKKLANAFALARGDNSPEESGREEEKPLDGGEVKICAGCIQRERKRASRKKQRKPDEDELFQRGEEKRVIVFNTNEIKDWTEPSKNAPAGYSDMPSPVVPKGSLQVELPMRIACYCRHQNEKIGFQVIFTIKDYRDKVVAQAITNSIMITDDHKTHTASTAPPPPSALSTGTQLPGAGVFIPAPIPESKGTAAVGHYPFRLSQSATDLQSLRNQSNSQYSSLPGPFTVPQTLSNGASATPTPRNLSRQASPTGFQGPSSKRRKQSGSAKVPAGLTMTKMETTPQTSPGSSTVQPAMPFSHFSPNSQSFHVPAERGYAIPTNTPPQFTNGPPTPNSNEAGFFGANSQPPSVEGLSQPQLISAPSSAHPSRPGTPGPSGRNSFQEQNVLASLNQVSSNQMWPSNSSTQRLPSIIHKLVPAEGSTTGGTEVTLLGSGFYPGMEVVFGDTLATTTTFWGDKCLNCLTPPALQPGTVPVVFKHEHPTLGQGMQNHTQPLIPRQLSYRYVDDRELQMYRLALGVLGQKLRNPADAFQTAQQIMGGDPSNLWNIQNNFQGNGGGHQRQVPGMNSAQSDMSDLDSKMLTYLEFIDLDDNPRPPKFNTRCASGQTLLHLASSLGLTRFVAGLLARGADPDTQDNNGNTPMHLAALSGHAHIVHRLRLAGADAKALSIREFTPADLATTLPSYQAALIPARHYRSRSVGSTPSRGYQRRSRSASVDSLGGSSSPTSSVEYSVGDSTDSGDDQPGLRTGHGLRWSKSHPDLRSVLSSSRPREGSVKEDNVEPMPSASEPSEDTRSFSPPAALVDWRNQLAAQINQFQQSVNRAFPNLPALPALPPMPALPDYQAHPMMRRITSLVPQRPTTPWPASISTEGWWDLLRGNQSPPPYEELYPKPENETDEDYSLKKSSMVQAAADAALDQQFETQGPSSSKGKAPVKEIVDVRISSKSIPREQQEQLRIAHARKIKKIRSDRNLFFIWIPLLVLVVVAMLRNFVPDAWQGIKQMSEFIKSRYTNRAVEVV